MTTTGCDLASIARDAQTYYQDAISETRNEILALAERVRAATLGSVVELSTQLDAIASALDDLSYRAGNKSDRAGSEFNDAFETIRAKWHEAVEQRAESMGSHEDCYSLDYVQEEIGSFRRAVLRAVTSAIEDCDG